MTNLVLHFIFGPETAVFANYGLWAFLSIGAIALFGIRHLDRQQAQGARSLLQSRNISPRG
jgi:hypothetical protein